MRRFNEVERIFLDDIREKKKAASGVHSMTGKRGYVGKMLFPTDFMSRKEKYNHRKASKVMTTNMYDEILTFEEFNKLETFEQRNHLAYWRSKYSNKEIQNKLKLNNMKYYGIVADLGLPKATRVYTEPRRAKSKIAAIKSNEETEIILSPMIPESIPEPIQEIMINGMHLIFNGTFSAEHIQKQLTKFKILLDGEPNEFYIELKIMQKEK